MSFVIKTLPSLMFAALISSVGISAIAQAPQPAPTTAPQGMSAPGMQGKGGPEGHRMGRHDPAKMQAWMAKRQAELKAKLNITSAQEPAWTAFTASMQPPVRGQRPAMPDLSKLSTPERIDQMRQMRTQRMAEMNARMDQREQATKSFYSALTPEQKKVFDTETLRRGHHHAGFGGHRGHRGHEGMQHGKS
ncbi:MAG: Spy/CpxP family protein refolding chaperone [Pseudomonadota bacterium]